jgi:anti-sigma-K factor RsiG
MARRSGDGTVAGTGSRATDRPANPTRPGARPVPERNNDFDHLPLESLRSYRAALGDEENRVSYWRRIVHARIDIILAGATAQPADIDSLRSVLARSSGVSTRTDLLRIVPADQMPPLPDLSELWDRDPIPGDDAFNAELTEHLTRVERELSAYRTALHARIASATVELIARYREEPSLCLTALPAQRGRRSVAS